MGIWSPGPGATGGADVFTGDDSNETADGLGGADILNGNRGADTLTGNDGDDTLRPGDDYVADIVSGGNNYDVLDYSSLVEDGIIYLGTISYRSYFDNSSLWDMISGVEEIIGTAASDLIFARPDGANVLRGGAGNDFMTAQNTTTNPDFYGGAGRDYFFLGASDYRIMDFQVGVDRFAFATIASMTISGADTLLTSSFGAVVRIVGINSLTLAQWQAHSNPDFVTFDALSDTHDQFVGGADDDWAWGGSGNDTFNGGFGDDTLLGGQGDDFIDAGNGADLLEGGSGDDILLGNVGADTVIGGSGVDTATWASLGIGITASLVTNTASDGDTLSGVENLTGTDQNDTLTGDAGANVLRGQSGGDALDGGDGADTLDGGAGVDVMTGGLGDDTLQADLAGLESGDQFLGGDGFDTIRVSDIVNGQQLFNFGLATVSSIERIQFASNVGISIVGFGAGQLGSGFSNFTEVVGSNGINLVSVVAVNPSNFSLENWSFTNWSGGDAVLLDGSSGNDVITGSTQADQMNGHEGVDTLNGGFGDDVFIVNLANLQAGDQYHGGDGVDTMRVGDSFAGQQLFNFGPADVSSIERIQFTSSTGQSIVGFRADQLGGGFSNFTHVIGSSTLSLVSIVATAPGSFSVAGWTFENWSGAVLLDGSSGGDTITGSTQTDFISGHDGNDQLFGGFGADTIEGGAGIDLMAGEFGNDTLRVRDTDPNPVTGDVFDGGADTDTLALMTSEDVGFWDVRTATLFSIERIDYSPIAPGQVAWLQIASGQIGGGQLSSALIVDGSDRPDVLQVNGAGGAFSLESFQFTNWTTGNDYVEIDGHETLADDITGSSVEDQVEGFGGDDIMRGLAGSDVLSGGDGADQLFGGEDTDFLFGGAGADFAGIDVNSTDAAWHRNPNGSWTVVTAAFGTDTLTSVEFISFNDRTVSLDRAARTFSGDGTSDILFRRSDGIMASWEVTGTTINSASFLPTAGAEWSALGTGDLSGDGRDDVIWQRSDGLVYSWTMNGGAVSAAVAITGIGADWTFLGVGDFNRDLVDDLAWRRDDGLVFIWTMQNSAIQSASAVTGLSAVWELAGLGDFNGDGRDDFLWRRADNGQTVIWHMNGASIESSGATSQQANLDWAVVGVGDTNGDGRDDIILQRGSDGMIAVWAMDGTNAMSATEVAAASPAQWNVRGVGDYNGDGRDDILWQHDNGLVYVWLMDGAAIQSAGALSGIGPEWSII